MEKMFLLSWLVLRRWSESTTLLKYEIMPMITEAFKSCVHVLYTTRLALNCVEKRIISVY